MILLSFDLEEFDLPLEQNVALSLDEQISYSKEGTGIILELLKKYNIKATFFCTAIFAMHSNELILEIINNGHEVASHGYSHSAFSEEDLTRSKIVLEELTKKPVFGYRTPRMKGTDMQKIADANYLYDSSLNPTYIPGRYNHLSKPRTCFFENGVLEIPASVTPFARIPLFWLSLHNFPVSVYRYFCYQVLRKDCYLNIYFHSWEFSDQLADKKLKVPFIVRRNSGIKLQQRLEILIGSFIAKGESFGTIYDYLIVNEFPEK